MSFLLRLVRGSFSVVRWIDRRDPWILRMLPSRFKRRATRGAYRLVAPILARRPITRDGLKFHVPPELAFSYLLREHEPETQRILSSTLRPGMRVVDVGANLGYLTALAARAVGPTGEVFAVEPSPRNLAFLQRNLVLNDIENVTLLPFAAGSDSRARSLFVSARGTLDSFYVRGKDSQIQEVQQRRLDDLIQPPVDFVKIDVEGAEIEALAGMSALLDASPGVSLYIEWNPSTLAQAGVAPEALPQALLDRGFSVRAIGGGDDSPVTQHSIALYLESSLHGTRYTNLLARRSETRRP